MACPGVGPVVVPAGVGGVGVGGVWGGGCCFRCVFEMCCDVMVVVNLVVVQVFTVVMRMVIRWYRIMFLVCNEIGDCECFFSFGAAFGCGV